MRKLKIKNYCNARVTLIFSLLSIKKDPWMRAMYSRLFYRPIKLHLKTKRDKKDMLIKVL